jgi:uncharacterized protein (UPF0261 family)
MLKQSVHSFFCAGFNLRSAFYKVIEVGMGDHVVLDVNKLLEPKSDEGIPASVVVNVVSDEKEAGAMSGVQEEAMPLLQMAECRICQDEDSVSNLEMPCACSGSLKVSLSLAYLPFLTLPLSLPFGQIYKMASQF